MKEINNLGIWIDHSIAQFIDIQSNKNNHFVKSKFTSKIKEEALSRSESIMHNKEQQMHEEYFKKIGNQILKYNHVLLFGPTNAKVELYNYLNKDAHFKNIAFSIESAEDMTDNEKDAYVKNHFEKK